MTYGRYGTRYRALRYWRRYGVLKACWFAMTPDDRMWAVILAVIMFFVLGRLCE